MSAAGALDPALRCVDSDAVLAVFRGHRAPVRAVDEHPRSALFATASDDGHVRVFRRGGELVWSRRLADAAYSVRFSPDGALLAACGSDLAVVLLAVADGAVVRLLEGHSGPVFDVAFSPTGRTLLSCGGDHMVRVWRVATGVQVRRLDAHADVVQAVAFSLDGRRAASGGRYAVVRLWCAERWAVVRELPTRGEVFGLLFTPDAARLVATLESRVAVWDVDSGRECCSVPGGTAAIGRALSMSCFGDRLAIASSLSGTVRVLDARALVDYERLPPVAVARASAEAEARVPVDLLARLPAISRACLTRMAFSRLPREARVGTASALLGTSVELLRP